MDTPRIERYNQDSRIRCPTTDVPEEWSTIANPHIVTVRDDFDSIVHRCHRDPSVQEPMLPMLRLWWWQCGLPPQEEVGIVAGDVRRVASKGLAESNISRRGEWYRPATIRVP